MTEDRSELFASLQQILAMRPSVRFGQLIAGLAAKAEGPQVSAVYDVEDDALLEAARGMIAFAAERDEAEAECVAAR